MDVPPISSSAAAAPPAVVTPAIDEAEQALFLASSAALMGGVVARSGQFHPVPPHPAAQPSLSEIERLVDAALPSYASFLSPATDASSFENYIGNDADALDAIASLAYAAATIATPPAKNDDDAKKFAQEPADVTNAAGILCQLMSGVVAAEDVREIADSAAEMMQIEAKDEEEDEEDEAYEPPEEPKSRPPTPAIFASAGSDSLVHPNRLAIAQDAEEVNRLHQYVRRDLLEVFVVPNTNVAEDNDDDSDDEDDEYAERPSKKQKSATGTSVTATSTTRRLVTRRRSIPMTADLVPSTNSLAHRHYAGRVGLRCTACANARPNAKGPNGKKVTVASKAAFYPLRLKNIYREVCAWQRIHFKKCPHVPDGVRARYDHYKQIDTSRGKVKYWESSARKIGLVNNPARDDGIVFATTSFKG